MYGNVNRKKHPDGGHYRDYFYYACKHRTFVNGHKCTYRKQWSEDKINAAVEEVIRKLVNNPKFKTEIQKHIGNSIDTQELDREHDGLKEQLSRLPVPRTSWRIRWITYLYQTSIMTRSMRICRCVWTSFMMR